ncbi:MAG: electron transfer flavoprotein subunit beta/FixA family protein [Armatimonadetes bacterium]|nr:electron transfer flavoprotein subunit beta/FixA family protein [Armatimonadota bacterium]
MKIIACVRQTPDTETLIKIQPDGKSIETEGVKFVLGPFDEYALEAAAQIKEKHGGEVTAVCVGPDKVKETLRHCLAVGADKAVHVTGLDSDDALAIAMALAAQLKTMGADLIFTSTKGADSDRGVVGPMLSELMGLPYVGLVGDIQVEDGGKSVLCKRDIEGGYTETIRCQLPAVICAQKGIRGEPRYASLMAIMKAKKKPIDSVDVSSLGANGSGVHVNLEKMEYPPQRPPGRMVEGDTLDAKIEELVRLLRQEAKVI